MCSIWTILYYLDVVHTTMELDPPQQGRDQGLQEGPKMGSNSMVDVYTFWQITSIMRRPFWGTLF